MDPQHPPARSRGIYLLPNLFTTGGLFAGFFAIIAASQGRFTAACIAIFVAGILDGIDGRVARLTNTQSEFGVQYDSLADLISFGMAPALVMFLPGTAITLAVIELSGRDVIAGSARLIAGGIRLAQLAFGILIAAQVVGQANVEGDLGAVGIRLRSLGAGPAGRPGCGVRRGGGRLRRG